MRVKLVGIHSVKAKLASGARVTYNYAWRGGPRMETDPADDHAFAAEYLRLTRDRDDVPTKDALCDLVRAYRQSPQFALLRPSTRKGYDAAIDTIESEFHDFPILAISQPGARRAFLEWRDQFAGTPRKADLTMAVFARILAFALDREMITRNPLERIGKLADGTRRDMVWSDEQIAAFRAVADPKLWLALELARWTGQRQGDLLRMTWTAYNGAHIVWRQGKTGKIVRVKVYSELKTLLDATKREAVTILTNTRGVSWTSDGFRASWGKVCERAGVKGVTFHDLRGTFVTSAYRAHGASIRDIAEVTGHSERDAEAIIRKHYLAGDSAIEHMEPANKQAPVL